MKKKFRVTQGEKGHERTGGERTTAEARERRMGCKTVPTPFSRKGDNPEELRGGTQKEKEKNTKKFYHRDRTKKGKESWGGRRGLRGRTPDRKTRNRGLKFALKSCHPGIANRKRG